VPRADFQCDSLIALLSLVANSDLLVFLPGQWLGSAIIENVIEEIPVRERFESPAICLVRRLGLPLTPAAEALAEAIRIEAQHRDRSLQPQKNGMPARSARARKAG
jgi:LysR family transcriptional regulator of abg operon